MKTLEHILARVTVRDDAAGTGSDGTTYQPDLSGSELIAELRMLFATQRRAEQLICRYLADLAGRIALRRDAVLGAYTDELHAARCFFGLGVRETRERVRVGRALRTLPRIEQAFIDGELSYSRVREVTRVATAQTESYWLSLSQTLDMRGFERRVAGARAVQASEDGASGSTGDGVLAADGATAPGASNDVAIARTEGADEQRVRTHWLSSKTVRVSFELPAEAWALVERALEGARRAGGASFGDGQALEAVARDALSAQTEGGDASDPRRAIVLYECRSCCRSELETGVGALEMDPVQAASLGCGAAVSDLHSEGCSVTRGGPLPAAVRRAVMLRDRCRCRVPGCTRRRYVDVHHLTAQAHGGEHSRRNCLVLCTTHHELLHDGKLTVTGDADYALSFCDASGRPIVAAPSVPAHLETLGGGVRRHAPQLESLREVGFHTTQAGSSVDGESSATQPDSGARAADGALHRTSQSGGSLAAATHLLVVMGRRGGWTMDALIESSGLLAREVAAILTWLELDGKVRNRSGAFEPV